MTDKGFEITALLERAAAGEPNAEGLLFDAVYDELRRIARGLLASEGKANTLQPTALVNEVFLRLPRRTAGWKNRTHFFAVAARAMRRVLIDRARARDAEKRPNPNLRVELNDILSYDAEEPTLLIALDSALDRLALVDPRQAHVVEMRFFAGMSEDEIAEELRISVRTVKRDWRFAQLWLYSELSGGTRPTAGDGD